MLRLGREICTDREVSSRREWLETNGIGGYACGTVAGMHTRSYHALLVAPLEVPLHRVILLSQLEETLIYHGKKIPLSTNQYRDIIAPTGYLYLEEFRLDPFPIFTYRIAELLLEKRIFMSHGKDLTWIVYHLLTPVDPEAEVILAVRPLLNFRDHHLRQRERSFVNTHHDLEKHVIRLLPNKNLPTLHLHHNAQGYEHSAAWYHDLFYREEKERGLCCEEDLFSPGVIHYNLAKQPLGFLAAATESLKKADPVAAAEEEKERRRKICQELDEQDVLGRALFLAADQFIVKRGAGLSAIAGYPWLTDCGRDLLISLPGLTLATRRFADAEAMLQILAEYCSEGMLPNHFAEEHAKANYNNVDVALWFFIAIHHYYQATQNGNFIHEQLWTTMEDIIAHYQKGTRYHIRMDDDGLITMPEEGAQLTWMDAQVGDWVVTPRSGKPVEVNALWYNALCIMRDLATHFSLLEAKLRYQTWAEKTRQSFETLFWNERTGCCFDRVEDHFQDPTLRPNQLFALSLPYPLITGERARRVLQVVQDQLYTAFGLRTLNRENEKYHGHYAGDLFQREGAAYQGTIWPWLLGPYIDAWLNTYGPTAAVKQEWERCLEPFVTHLTEAGVGSISEMFDGDSPHTPRGCIARVWNVAELLRLHMQLRAWQASEKPA